MPLSVADVEAADLAARIAALEKQLAAGGGDVVHAGEETGHGAHLASQCVAAGNAGEDGAGVIVLGVEVGVELGLGLGLHPAIRVGDAAAEIVVGDGGGAGNRGAILGAGWRQGEADGGGGGGQAGRGKAGGGKAGGGKAGGGKAEGGGQAERDRARLMPHVGNLGGLGGIVRSVPDGVN